MTTDQHVFITGHEHTWFVDRFRRYPSDWSPRTATIPLDEWRRDALKIAPPPDPEYVPLSMRMAAMSASFSTMTTTFTRLGGFRAGVLWRLVTWDEGWNRVPVPKPDPDACTEKNRDHIPHISTMLDTNQLQDLADDLPDLRSMKGQPNEPTRALSSEEGWRSILGGFPDSRALEDAVAHVNRTGHSSGPVMAPRGVRDVGRRIPGRNRMVRK